MAIQTVAVAGATGSIGVDVVKQLVAAGFTVTALKRASGQSPAHLEGVLKVLTVDYDDLASLTEALKGYDAVVSALGSFASQDVLADACVAAGVKRFIPSEYGLDYDHPRISELPIFVPKLAYRKRLAQLAKANPSFSWTVVSTGMFLEWSVKNNFLFDASPSGDAIGLWDGGNSPTATSTYEGVGRGVAGVLENEVATKNRTVRISQAEITQKQVLAIVSKHRHEIVGRGTVDVDSEDAYYEAISSMVSGKSDDPWGRLLTLLRRAMADNIGAIFPALDNELLGVKRLGADELEQTILSSLS